MVVNYLGIEKVSHGNHLKHCDVKILKMLFLPLHKQSTNNFILQPCTIHETTINLKVHLFIVLDVFQIQWAVSQWSWEVIRIDFAVFSRNLDYLILTLQETRFLDLNMDR